MQEKFKQWCKDTYQKLIAIKDTPHRKALGLGLGVFLGIFPGVGPIASLVGAYILQVNKAAALLGSVLTNTWFTFLTLGIAIKIGAEITGRSDKEIEALWKGLIFNFQWAKLKDPEILNMFLAIAAGFSIISLFIGTIVYMLAYKFFLRHEQKK